LESGQATQQLGKRAISAVNVAREPIVDDSIEALGAACPRGILDPLGA
jgi:hypothetical protein